MTSAYDTQTPSPAEAVAAEEAAEEAAGEAAEEAAAGEEAFGGAVFGVYS